MPQSKIARSGVAAAPADAGLPLLSFESMIERLKTFSLSARETEVVTLSLAGMSLKEIAGRLTISSKTVEQYWSRIFVKVGCRGRDRVIAKLLRTESLAGASDSRPG